MVTKETPLAQVPKGVEWNFIETSPDCRHVALIGKRGKKQFVIADGLKGREYDEVTTFGLYFSPDSKRLAYVATRSGKKLVVVDGQEGNEYDGVDEIVFSPDSTRVAYNAYRDKKWLFVIDGVEYPESIGPVFSPDSKRVAWVTCHEHKCSAVIDGLKGPGYDRVDALDFSLDSTRMKYLAQKGREYFVVVDGTTVWNGEGDMLAMFSPDGQRIGLTAIDREGSYVVIDGERGKRYDRMMSSPRFSPNSKRVAYSAMVNKQWLMVIDGAEGKTYDDMSLFGFSFSPDSQHTAYAGERDGKSYLVRDGVEQPYEGRYAWECDPLFSPDSNRLAYVEKVGDKGEKEGKMVFVVDGKRGRRYDGIWPGYTFSPDSRHTAFWAWRGDKNIIVVDGVESRRYDDFPIGAELLFDSPDAAAHHGDSRPTATSCGSRNPGKQRVGFNMSLGVQNCVARLHLFDSDVYQPVGSNKQPFLLSALAVVKCESDTGNRSYHIIVCIGRYLNDSEPFLNDSIGQRNGSAGEMNDSAGQMNGSGGRLNGSSEPLNHSATSKTVPSDSKMIPSASGTI